MIFVFSSIRRRSAFMPFLIVAILYTLPLSAADAGKEKLVNSFLGKADLSTWFGNAPASKALETTYKSLLDSCVYLGLNKQDYNYALVKTIADGIYNGNADDESQRKFVESMIGYFKDLRSGNHITEHIGFDEISPRYSEVSDSIMIAGLLAVKSGEDLMRFATDAEPKAVAYVALRSELRRQITAGDDRKVLHLKHSLNLYRWILHYGFKQCIIVNIAGNMLWYYEQDDMKLPMKVVVGKPATKTPRFAAHCNQVIFYPYWHVPRSIAIKEILPSCKKNPGALNRQNLQALNNKGQIVDPYKINWKSLSASNFPYTLRQPTGCDNALGVIKFNLTSPYSVYLHDTNWKGAFSNNKRFFSHGCIRIEKPVELANYLLPGQVDKDFLERCIKGQQSVPKDLKVPVPVFVIYMTADADSTGNGVVYYPDTYRLL